MKGGREALRLFKISLHLFDLCINDVQRNDGRLGCPGVCAYSKTMGMRV